MLTKKIIYVFLLFFVLISIGSCNKSKDYHESSESNTLYSFEEENTMISSNCESEYENSKNSNDNLVEIFAKSNNQGYIFLGEDEDYIYMMQAPKMPGPTTLIDVENLKIYDDVLMRKCKKIELTNLSGNHEVVSVGVGEQFLGLTITSIEKTQYLVENNWVDYNVIVEFSGVLEGISGDVHVDEVGGSLIVSEESYNSIPAICLENNPPAKTNIGKSFYSDNIFLIGPLDIFYENSNNETDGVRCKVSIKDYTLALVWGTGMTCEGQIVKINDQEIIV